MVDMDNEKTFQRDTREESLEGEALVVDDELINRVYMRKLLEKRGCTVFEAENGEAALDICRKSQPDLALVDVMMPGLDGYEVCRRIKRDSLTSNCLVIMVTAKTDIEDIEEGFSSGAMDFISKPFNPREFMIRVRNALQLKHATDDMRLWQAKMSHELEVAGTLQRSLMSLSPFCNEAIEARVGFRSSLDVGGDVLDIIKLDRKRFCIYIGDVAGHGVAPAMVSSMMKAMLDDLVTAYFDRGPAFICNELASRFRNQINNPAIYATMILSTFDLDRDEWRLMNCGHPRPFVFTDSSMSSKNMTDGKGGVPIGFDLPGVDNPYSVEDEVNFNLKPNSHLVFYTDGLTEANLQDSGEEIGEKGFEKLVASVLGEDPPIDVPNAVLDEAGNIGCELSDDDCSLIVVHVNDPAAVKLLKDVPCTMEDVMHLASEVEQVVLAEGWSEKSAAIVQLLVMEHGANTVEHGGLSPEANFYLQLFIHDDKCKLIFSDRGWEWDIGQRLKEYDPNDTMYAESGRGLMMIKTIASHMEHFRRNDENMAIYVIERDLEVPVDG